MNGKFILTNPNGFLNFYDNFDLFLVLEGIKNPEMPHGTFFKPKFFDFMKEEYLACREGVGIIDMSSFSKIEIKVISFVWFYSILQNSNFVK